MPVAYTKQPEILPRLHSFDDSMPPAFLPKVKKRAKKIKQA